MQCRLPRLIPVFAILSLSSCATPVPTDSFCQTYNKVIVQKGDGNIVASDGVKRRLLANELFFRQQCPSG